MSRSLAPPPRGPQHPLTPIQEQAAAGPAAVQGGDGLGEVRCGYVGVVVGGGDGMPRTAWHGPALRHADDHNVRPGLRGAIRADRPAAPYEVTESSRRADGQDAHGVEIAEGSSPQERGRAPAALDAATLTTAGSHPQEPFKPTGHPPRR